MTEADAWAEAADAVFIVGAPRSGTTVMGRTLVESPGFWKLRNVFETRAFQQGYLAAPELSAPAAGYLASRLDAFLQARPALSGRDLARRYFYEASLHYGPGRLVEKTPHHVHTLPALFDAFPKARVLVMLRSVRETVISRRTRLQRDRDLGVAEEQLAWLSAPIEALLKELDWFDRGAAHAFETWPQAAHGVSYECLTKDPATELAQVGECLGMSDTDTAEMIRLAVRPRPPPGEHARGSDVSALFSPLGPIARPTGVLTDAEEAALAAHRFVCLPP